LGQDTSHKTDGNCKYNEVFHVRPFVITFCSSDERTPQAARLSGNLYDLETARFERNAVITLHLGTDAIFAAVASFALIHRAILARVLAIWLVRCKRDRT
jgi:hypothetical protein